MKIVSFRGKQPLRQWLLRQETETPAAAVPFKVIVATGVSFRHSRTDADSFGGGMIAYCYEAIGYDRQVDLPQKCVRLYFSGGSFHTDKTNVRTCKTAYFLADGRMYCVFEELSPQVRRPIGMKTLPAIEYA